MTTEEIHEKALEYMRTVYDADPAATHALVVNRVPTNQAMIDHPFARCDETPLPGGQLRPNLGMLGVINGLLAAIGLAEDQLIATQWDGEIEPNFVGFMAYIPPKE